jgi:hypothetical protein
MIIIFQCHPELVSGSVFVSESYYLILNKEENLKQVQVDKLKNKKFGKFFHSTMKDVKKMKGR